jgi:phosphoglycerate dehydrogenase-like enzyme
MIWLKENAKKREVALPMEKAVHVLSVLNLSEKHLARLRAVSPRLVVEQRSLSTEQGYRANPEEFKRVLSPEVEILYGHNAPFDLSLTPDLRWLQVNSAGVDFLRKTPLWHNDEITITSANGIHAIQIAEYVLTMLLAHVHHLPTTMRWQAQADWSPKRGKLFTRELRGQTLGILGYGAIGREVGRLAAAFGMRVLATKRRERPTTFDGWTPAGTGDPDGSIPERFYDLDELLAMLPECDMLILALPLSPQTYHLIGQAELALMRPHALLINIGRGPLLDHEALVTALQAGHLGGVALDVTEPEPLPSDSPLWQIENVIITPHISGLSVYYDDRIVELLSENLRRYLANQPLVNQVSRALGY